MLAAPSRPIFERLALEPADQLCRRRALPQAGIAMLLRAADPPALTRQAVRLPHNQHRKLGVAGLLQFVVDITEHLAQSAHLRPREIVAEQPEDLGIRNRLARGGARD